MSTGSSLWAVSTKGNAYILSTKSSSWKQIDNEGQCLQGFKKIAATNEGAWGLGCDHLVYLYIAETDVPIRVQEVTYENERWVLSLGWSGKNLLPHVDPWHWSNLDGSVHLAKEDFKLPSKHWIWESDWIVDENVKGYLTDKGGWRYSSLGFHYEFTHKKKMNSCVRRRRWISYRRYAATNRWARLPSIHMDPLEEPIVDITVGGQEIPNQPRGFAGVWIATINGRVLYRVGVTAQCPEGQSWKDIPSENDQEVLNLSMGPTGLLWAITWSGDILVRLGVNWHNPTGTGWKALAPPPGMAGQAKLIQCAAGTNAAWVSSTEGHVWLRKGIHTQGGDLTESNVCGSGWLQMTNKMKMTSIGTNDHVWGIDEGDYHIYFRKGITRDEPSGRTWQCIDLPYHISSRESTSAKASNSSDIDASEFFMNVETANADVMDLLRIKESSDAKCVTDNNKRHAVLDIKSTDESRKEIASASQSNDPIDNELESSNSQEINSQNKSCVTTGNEDTSGISHQMANSTKRSFSSKVVSKMPFKKHEKAIQNVFEHFEKKVHKGIERGIESGTAKGKQLSSTIQDRVPVVKEIKHEIQKRYSAPPKNFVSLQFSKDEDGKEKYAMEEKETENTSTTSHEDLPTPAQEFIDENKLQHGEEDLSLPTASNTDSKKEKVSISIEPNIDVEAFEEGENLSMCSSVDIPAWISFEAERDEGEIQWSWVSAAACKIEDESAVRQWFVKDSDSSDSLVWRYRVSQAGWRSLVLQQLRKRNQEQRAPFSHYKLTVEQGSWTKNGKLKWWQDLHRGQKWLDCNVELTQECDSQAKFGTFTLQYEYKGDVKFLQIDLSSITCVSAITDKSQPAVLGLFTRERLAATPRLPPIKLALQTMEEMEDWQAAISVRCIDQRNIEYAPQDCSLWSISERGDVFSHQPDPAVGTELCNGMFWQQLGGHLKVVESNICGIVWGIGHNGIAYAYTGGYGGGFFKGIATSRHGIHSMVDYREYFVYENQQWRVIRGYTDRVFLADHYVWSDETGKKEATKDGTKTMSVHWQWFGDWTIDHRTPGGVDQEGWQYSRTIYGPFYPRPRFRSNTRRRRWCRRAKTVTKGPWLEVGPIPLQSVSMQLDASGSKQSKIALWAVGLNGDVLCRVGVTKENPQGVAWNHINTDQPFCDVSLGGAFNLWAVAKDGSAWLRQGVTEQNIIGSCWVQVPPPSGAHLIQIAAGVHFVMAVDSNNVLWGRQEISESQPEGARWVQMYKNVQQVSIGARDQLWVILNDVSSKAGQLTGVISRRVGVDLDNPKAGVWDHGVGGGWTYICARGWTK